MDADAESVFEMFGIYAVLLAGWGLWRHRREVAAAAAAEPAARPVPAPAAPVHERGAAARRHLNAAP